MAEKLEPCPFCWNQAPRALLDKDRPFNRWAVWCAACGTTGPVAPDKAEAARLWNRRPRIEPPADGGEGADADSR